MIRVVDKNLDIILDPIKSPLTPLDKGGKPSISLPESDEIGTPLTKGGLRGDLNSKRPQPDINLNMRKENQKELIPTGFHLPYNPELIPLARALRKNMTVSEKKLWYNYLSNFKYRVLRQRPIDHYIVDFYCPKLKLVIEIDGDSHFINDGKKYDEKRTIILEGYGLKVLRFLNTDVMQSFEGVYERIEEIANSIIPPHPP